MNPHTFETIPVRRSGRELWLELKRDWDLLYSLLYQTDSDPSYFLASHFCLTHSPVQGNL